MLEIESVQKGSIAAELGLEPGDKVTHMGGEVLRDCIDSLYFEAEAKLPLVVRKKDGSTLEVEVRKEEYEALGIQFVGDGLGKKPGLREQVRVLLRRPASKGHAANAVF